MNLPAIFKNRTFQVGLAIAAMILFFPALFGWVLSKALFWGAVAGVGYLGYQHVYKPWKAQKNSNSNYSNQSFGYDSKAVQREINEALKKSKK